MRSLVVLIVGLGILAVLYLLSAELRRRYARHFNAPLYFVIGWAVFILVDLYIGVGIAGYGLGEALAIHALLFFVPVTVVWYLRRRG